MTKKRIFLYYTEACHLCEQAILVFDAVMQYQATEYSVIWELNKVDIANDEKLFERFGVSIPVLQIDGEEVNLGWPFDEAQLNQYLLTYIK